MTIALFSDVHANLPALEALFADLETQKPYAVYCLGDLVGYNVWGNEVVNAIREKGISTLAGNHDLKVKLDDGSTQKVIFEGKNYAYAIIGENEKSYLLTLPAHIRLSFVLNGAPVNVLMVHGSPRSVNEYLLEDMDETLLTEIMSEANADILCFGHSHKPYHRTLRFTSKEGKTTYKHAINIGSVGKPKDGDTRGCYVLLHLDTNANLDNAESIKVEHIRFEYDVAKAAKAIEDSPLPNEFAQMLREAF